MHRGRVGWHGALRGQVAVKRVAGWAMIEKLNRPNLEDAMAFQRVEPDCLGVDDYFTHGGATGSRNPY